MSDLDALRSEIDRVDRELIDLLEHRAELARSIGRIKGVDGAPIFTPERERKIYARLEGLPERTLGPRRLKAIFREIISAARDAERPLRVAYWGPDGSYCEMAARQTFGASAGYVAATSIDEVFRLVEHHKADYGVAPIENSIAGMVPATLDRFPSSSVRIVAETFLPIHHHLGSLAASLEGVRRIYAGPQPAQQCRRWLEGNAAGIEVVDVVPTSEAMRRALDDPDGAVIGNRGALERLGLPVLAEHLENDAHNRTRFVVLGFNQPAPSGSDKTSLLVNVSHKPGELYEVLGSFSRHRVNMTMIESRPCARDAFSYLFFIDCEGHRDEGHLAAAIAEIRERAAELTVLGSFPSRDDFQDS